MFFLFVNNYYQNADKHGFVYFFRLICILGIPFLKILKHKMFTILIVIYATRFCVNWNFLIAREARLKYERSEKLEKPNLHKNELHTKFYCLKRRPQSFQIY
jgi:hypothetical protein